MRITTVENKLNFYDLTLDYIEGWIKDSHEISENLTKFMKEKTKDIDTDQLKLLTHYHIEISKIMYASLALIDKINRNKERLEKWKKDLASID